MSGERCRACLDQIYVTSSPLGHFRSQKCAGWNVIKPKLLFIAKLCIYLAIGVCICEKVLLVLPPCSLNPTVYIYVHTHIFIYITDTAQYIVFWIDLCDIVRYLNGINMCLKLIPCWNWNRKLWATHSFLDSKSL